MKRVLRHLAETHSPPSSQLEYLPYEEGITTRKGDRSVALVLAPPQQDRANPQHTQGVTLS
ncbi:MAG: hypothetical protein Q3M24_16860 [Candidatus Electrothrix aestuarii]|uniref:Uncharacterized protein n=1 Tax=Candidatus Electrothrix aestuarii TaxID=3062594 RepID=A0AAU8LSD6_9BACT